MLAKKDVNGVVEMPLPGLAREAVLTIDETVEALKVLMSPDVHSQSKEFQGRRVERVDCGWKILNHEKYMAEMAVVRAERRRAYQRIKQREYRFNKKTGGGARENLAVEAERNGDPALAGRIAEP